jgi:hypothetical protein
LETVIKGLLRALGVLWALFLELHLAIKVKEQLSNAA